MKRILMVVLAVTLAGGAAQAVTDTPYTPRIPATMKDYREVLRMLRGINETLDELDAAVSRTKADDGWPPDCRGLSPEKTIRCGAEAFHPPGGVEQALAVWRCESGWGTEPDGPMGHSYHGSMQYLPSTFLSQQAAIPDVVDWFELRPDVHDMRSNMLTALAWSARFGWGPWSCA